MLRRPRSVSLSAMMVDEKRISESILNPGLPVLIPSLTQHDSNGISC